MSREIFCQKLHKNAQGLMRPPMPGALGERVFNHISAEAWQAWLTHQTMLINEYRLNLMELKSRQFLLTELEKFLFGEGSEKPAGYIPKNSSST